MWLYLARMGRCSDVIHDMQRQKSEDSQFQHVYIYQEMDEGNARRLRDLDQLFGALLKHAVRWVGTHPGHPGMHRSSSNGSEASCTTQADGFTQAVSQKMLQTADHLMRFAGGKFDADIGSAQDGSAVEDLSVGLWAAFHQLARAPSNSLKKVYIMTNDPGPADDEAQHDRCTAQMPCHPVLKAHVSRGRFGVASQLYTVYVSSFLSPSDRLMCLQ